MATAKEIIYNIQNLRTKGSISQSDKLTNSQILFIVNYYRSKLITEFYNKNLITLSSFDESLYPIELIDIDASSSDSGCAIKDFKTHCVKRSKFQIPHFINTRTGNLITYVGDIDGINNYHYTTFEKVVYDLKSKYTGRLTKYYISDNYIYIINPKTPRLKYIRIHGVFQEPDKVQKFKIDNLGYSSSFDFSDPFNYKYPIELSMLDTIFKLIADSEFRFLVSMIQDNTTNANASE